VTDAIVYQLNHTAWQGLRFYDTIWPSFMLMVGVALPFSLAKARLTQTQSQLVRKALTRAAVLFLLGSLRESVSLNAPYWVELSSALQPIAVAYLAAFFLARTPIKVQAAVGGLLLVGYAALLAFVPAPGVPAGSYAKGANLVLATDLAVLGRAHLEGWGTVICTIPAIATTILGLILGELLMSSRSKSAKLRIIVITGARRAAGYGSRPRGTRGDEALDHLLRHIDRRLGLPDVCAVLLGDRCGRFPALGVSVCGDRHERSGRLHGGDAFSAQPDRRDFHARGECASRGTGARHHRARRRVGHSVLDVSPEDFPPRVKGVT
jgi:hypothetical protein